jgi:hypothetical protein
MWPCPLVRVGGRRIGGGNNRQGKRCSSFLPESIWTSVSREWAWLVGVASPLCRTKLLLDMLTGYVKRFRSLIESAWLLFKLGNRFARSSYLLGMSSSNIAGVILTTPMGWTTSACYMKWRVWVDQPNKPLGGPSRVSHPNINQWSSSTMLGY